MTGRHRGPAKTRRTPPLDVVTSIGWALAVVAAYALGRWLS